MTHPRTGRICLWIAIVLPGLLSGCGPGTAQNLDDLMVRDSTYLDPGTLEPFSGRIVRYFVHDTTLVEVEGRLQNGTWAGELTIYHPSGRIRDQGRLMDGAKCGAWVEDSPDRPTGGIYDEVVREVESLSIYPDCTED